MTAFPFDFTAAVYAGESFLTYGGRADVSVLASLLLSALLCTGVLQ